MVIANLFDGRFEQYFEQLRAGPPLWLFVHVPKTAGSSLNGELVPLLAPHHHIFIDYSQTPNRSYHELFDEAVDRFIGLTERRRYAYCTGHITARHVERISTHVAETRPITLLRDPVSRFVSDYRYQCSPMHPGNEQFRAAYPTIEPYLELPGEWNKAATYLLPDALRAAGDPEACVDYMMRNFAFIGIQECYPLSLRLITTLAGKPRRPKVFKRVNTPTDETGIRLSTATEASIRERNALDIAVYEVLSRRFAAMAGRLEAYLDTVSPMPPAVPA